MCTLIETVLLVVKYEGFLHPHVCIQKGSEVCHEKSGKTFPKSQLRLGVDLLLCSGLERNQTLWLIYTVMEAQRRGYGLPLPEASRSHFMARKRIVSRSCSGGCINCIILRKIPRFQASPSCGMVAWLWR